MVLIVFYSIKQSKSVKHIWIDKEAIYEYGQIYRCLHNYNLIVPCQVLQLCCTVFYPNIWTEITEQTV